MSARLACFADHCQVAILSCFSSDAVARVDIRNAFIDPLAYKLASTTLLRFLYTNGDDLVCAGMQSRECAGLGLGHKGDSVCVS